MARECIVIGDIKKSRELENWPQVFDSLQSVLSEVNSQFKSEITVPFATTVGDEFQGGLRSPKRVYDICLTIRIKMAVEIYCGIGVGEIERPLGELGMRGTAFYRAREALDLCKDENRWIFLSSCERPVIEDRIVNTFFHILEVFEGSWTERQKEIVNLLRTNRHLTYKEVGKRFGISGQSISKTLKSARWEAVREIEELLPSLFENLYEFTRKK